MEPVRPWILTDTDTVDVTKFIEDGFVRIPGAFARKTADAARAILWRDTGCTPDDPATWTRPVIRLGMYAQAPFVDAANTPVLHAAFDAARRPGTLAAGATAWARSRCASPRRTIPATPAGTSTRASATTIPTSSTGASTSARADARC